MARDSMLYSDDRRDVAVRGVSVALGIGLAILWLVGLNYHAAAWLTWLDGVGALIAFGIGASLNERLSPSVVGGAPIALSLGLFVLWIVGLVMSVETWLVWWTFVFACAFLLLGLGAAMPVNTRRTTTTTRTV